MNENKLPKGWVEVKIEDIGAKKYYAIGDGDHGKITPNMYQNEGIPYIRVADIGWGSFNPEKMVFISENVDNENLKSELLPNDVLIAKTGATIGKCCIVPENIKKANTTSSVGKVTVNPKLTSSKFLLYYFLSPKFYNLMWSYSNRTAQPGFNNRDLKIFPIPLPPKAEQERMVEKLDALFAQLEVLKKHLQTVPQLLKDFKQSVLNQAVTGKLKMDNGKLKVEEWKETTLGEISSVVRGGSPRPAGDPKFYGGDIPFVKVKDITKDSNKFLESYEYTITEAGLRKTRQLKKNTVLLTNSGATLGVPKITNFNITINDGVAAFLNLKNSSEDYLYYFLLTQTENFRNINKGAAQPNLNTDIIKNWFVLLPPLSEQEEIVKKVESLLTKAEVIEQKYLALKQEIDALPQSILAKAFRGELVPQLPTDGSAKDLLEEIAKLKQL